MAEARAQNAETELAAARDRIRSLEEALSLSEDVAMRAKTEATAQEEAANRARSEARVHQLRLDAAEASARHLETLAHEHRVITGVNYPVPTLSSALAPSPRADISQLLAHIRAEDAAAKAAAHRAVAEASANLSVLSDAATATPNPSPYRPTSPGLTKLVDSLSSMLRDASPPRRVNFA